MTKSKSLTKVSIPKYLKHLKPKQAQFVLAYVRMGEIKRTAEAVGVSERTGQRYYADPAVRDAILKALNQQRARWAVLGFNTLAEVAETADTDAARISAAKELIRRGIGEVKDVTEHRHEHHVGAGTAALMDRIAELQKELGIGSNVVEAEFTEVEEEPGGSLLKKLPFQVA